MTTNTTTKQPRSSCYSVRFAPGLDSDGQARLWADLESVASEPVGPSKARKPSRAAWERRGAANLAREDHEDASKRETHLVRVFYRSAGGEVLAFDSGAMTWQARDRFVADLRTSDALGWETWDTADKVQRKHGGESVGGDWDRPGWNGAQVGITARKSARLILLPSQMDTPVIVSEEQAEPETTREESILVLSADDHDDVSATADIVAGAVERRFPGVRTMIEASSYPHWRIHATGPSPVLEQARVFAREVLAA